MYISKQNREYIKNMFNGKCGYSGKDLGLDWQIDHIKPIRRNSYAENIENDNINNMIPCQKLINNYKYNCDLETFRQMIKTLHLRIAKLPKNPKTEKSIKHKNYLLQIADFFEITSEKNFNGIFYFETIKK